MEWNAEILLQRKKLNYKISLIAFDSILDIYNQLAGIFAQAKG